MRLAYFVDSMEVGGSELNALRTIERLDRSRFDLTVFHMGSRGPLLERYTALGLPMVHVSLSSFKHPSALLAGLRFVRELHRRRIQILHSHDIYSNIFAIPWARFAGTPVVIASKRWIDAIPSALHARANRWASRMASGVLANSAAVAESLTRIEGLSAGRIMTIPNFVGPEAFDEYPDTLRRERLAALGVPAGSIVVGVVARLSPVKDHALLLRAAVGLCARHPNLHILLMGDGPSRSALEVQVRESGLGARVHFAGAVPNIPNPHGLLDISVLPSRTEGFPNAVVEAMAAGRPVVATAVGGIPEAVVPEATGLLVPAGDEAALMAAVERLVTSAELRRSFGAAGCRRARSEYHADVVLSRLSDWYDSLLASH